MKKICFVATIPYSVRVFLSDPIQRLSSEFEVTVVSNLDERASDLEHLSDVRLIHVPFARKPSPWIDLNCFFQLVRLFRMEKFDSVHSIMPKTGLLSMTAGWLARVPVRIHTFTGQVWATQTGLSRFLLKMLDRFFAARATHLLVDSFSQREFLIREGVVSSEKSNVLAAGSICGVDTVRFSADSNVRKRIRSEVGAADDDVVFLFLGRLNRDKGVLMLAEAFLNVSNVWKNARLLIVGPDEEGLKNNSVFQTLENVVFVDYTTEPERYMNAADVFCLPSRREGFGSVIIEAACVGVPAIASRIYGIMDAIVDGQTGLLHDPYSADELAACMTRLLESSRLRQGMGQEAQKRAVSKFSKERVSMAFVGFYRERLG